jgi:hypothetical protein
VPAYVATFYSFKGGVGRTTLLVNVAHVLAARGERVLIWDLDLEAPGVHHFPGLEPPEAVWQSGFLEWLGNTPPCPTPEPTAAWPTDPWLRALGDRVYEAREARDAPGARGAAGGGRLDVLPAHGTHANLGRAYGTVDWHNLFVERPAHGLHLFARVRDMLIDRFEPTFLFIDSRTGISDLGGFLTGFLPDCTILVGNYSRQSTEGLRGVYLALDRFATERVKAEPYRARRLERVLVASPVPSSLPARERGRQRWLSGFSGEAPRSVIEVPLVESLLYAEDVLVRSAPSSDAARAYHAVAEIVAALQQSRARTEPAARAATEGPDDGGARLEHLLTLLGFELVRGARERREGAREARAAGGARAGGLLIRQRTLAGPTAYQVEYLAGTARLSPALREVLARPRRDGAGLLVIADAARDDARDAVAASGATLRTVQELEEQLLDLPACAAAVRRTFEDSELSRAYVAPRVVTSDGTTVDALEYTMQWLATAGPRLLLVRGDAGSGKTSLLRRVAYELALRAGSGGDPPTPIALELRHATAGTTLDDLLQHHLRALIAWHGNPEAVRYLLHAGRVVILLDGFDELAAATAETAEEQLRALAAPTAAAGAHPGANRMIVACGPSVRLESAIASSTALGAAPVAAPVTVIDLSPFAPDQVARFLRNRLGNDRARVTLDAMRGADAAPVSPMLLALLAAEAAEPGALAPAGGTRPSGSGAARGAPDRGLEATALIARHVDRWIEGEPAVGGLGAEPRARVVERLAAELWRLAARELPYAQLVAAVRGGEPELAGLPYEELDRVLRTAPFLARTDAGAYGFSHRSLLDHVLARFLLRRARDGQDALRAALVTERLDAACTARFAELAEAHAEAQDAARAVAAGPYAADASENAVRLVAAIDARATALAGGAAPIAGGAPGSAPDRSPR